METKSVASEQSPAPAAGKGIAAWPEAIKTYFEELRAEMRRVTWPNEKQVKATTLVVIVSVFAFAIYFFLVDFIILRGINQIFKVLAR